MNFSVLFKFLQNRTRIIVSLLLLFSVCLSSLYVKAQAYTSQVLVLVKADGKKECFLMEDNPVVKFSDGDLSVSTTDHIISYPLSEIRYYYFSKEGYGAVNEAIDISGSVSFNNNILSIYNGSQSVVVNVFNADGTLLISERIREFAHFSLDMKEYSSGVYIVRNGDSTFKIII